MDALFCLYLLAWLPYVLTQTFCQEVSVRMSNITSYIDYNGTVDFYTISHWSHLSYKGNPDVSIGTLAGGAGSGGGSTATILGAVAVAGVAGGGIAYVVKHFRSGGSVKSLIATAIRNRSKIADTLKDMPIPDSVKSKMMNAESLIPDSAKDLIKAAKSPQDLINNLPIPEELKSHLKRKAGNINMEEKLMKMLQDASGVDLKPTLDMAEEGEVEEEVEEVQTVNVTLDEKPVTTIVVDQGIVLTSRASKKSVNIVVESEEGTNSVSK